MAKATKKAPIPTPPAVPDLQVDTARGRVVAAWSPALDARVNRADEDLVMRVLEPGGAVLRQYRVSHFSRKEFSLAPGRYRLELLRSPRPQLEIRTTGRSSPVVVWVRESSSSHVVTWSGIDWDAVRYEVEQLYGVDWDRETELALRIRWKGLPGGHEGDWHPVPHRDHFTLRGAAESVHLAIRRRPDGQVLKTILTARRRVADSAELLAGADLEVPSGQHPLELTRVLLETDSLQARADWFCESRGKLHLHLERDGQPYRPAEDRPVGAHGDWHFGNLEPGRYVARLVDERGATVQQSPPLDLAEPPTRVVLMPVDEKRLFAYWHVGPEVWRELASRHGELLGRVHCVLRVFHDYAGGLHHHPNLDRDVHLDGTSDYYLPVDPDRVYRVQLVALVDGWKLEPLTPVSNPAQTGRLSAGSNPRSHRWVPDPISHPTVRPVDSVAGSTSHNLGELLLHLHAHLPFVPDPVSFEAGDPWRPAGYPQEWYAEAVRETYLPLLDTFERLVAGGVDFKISMDLSPPLVAMMRSPRHQADTLEYLDRLVQLAYLEVERTRREEPHYEAVARMHLHHLRRCQDLFRGYGCDLSRAFRRFQDLGKLELMTCVGTHPMLPLWQTEPQALRGQVFAATEYHEQVFGRPSLGIWLPECAYAPGCEGFLEEAGIRYFFGESLAVVRGDTPAEFGVNAPVYVRGSKVAVFPRDPETGEQVWSGDLGYPGDPDYLDFHIRGGPFKYNRITSRTSGLYKEPYNPDWATGKAASHAHHFLESRNRRFEYLQHHMWKKPLIVAPYDAELFGHHWYEGPQFLYFLFKKIHFDQSQTRLTTGAAYLAENPTAQELWPSVSSWGAQASFDKWMVGSTSWMYRPVHEAAREMGRLAREGARGEPGRRVLKQAARQLMLAMSSDLPFVISNGHFVDRMKGLFFDALRGFWELAAMHRRLREGGGVDLARLHELELENNLFPDVDPSRFAL